MTLVGIALSSNKDAVNTQLVRYALSLFEGCESEVIVIENTEVEEDTMEDLLVAPVLTVNSGIISTIRAAELVLLSLEEMTNTTTQESLIEIITSHKGLKDKAYLLISYSSDDTCHTLDYTVSQIKNVGGEVWGSYFLPYVHDNFDVKEQSISNIGLRLQLMRQINQLRYKKLGLSDRHSSCGIERPSREQGDESDY